MLDLKDKFDHFLLGAFEIVLGLMMILASPGSGGTLVFWAASIWAFISGALLVADAVRLRRNRTDKEVEPTRNELEIEGQELS